MEDIIMNELEDKAIDIAEDAVGVCEEIAPKGNLKFWLTFGLFGVAGVAAVALYRKNKPKIEAKKLEKAIKTVESNGYAVYAVDPVVEDTDDEVEVELE